MHILFIIATRTFIKTTFLFLLLLLGSTTIHAALENSTCEKCHPVIFEEYQHSMHSRASIFKDPIHRAVWDKYPDKKKGNYKCAKCHTPSDYALMEGKTKLADNAVQENEPISCQQCHRTQSVEEHTKANKNIMSKKEKYFFSADKARKGKKIEFRAESSLFGLMTKTVGSPYHDIDYSNENFYNGNVCMGCHSHKQNGKGFTVCDLEVKQKDSKETCISCHMPKVQGTFVNLKDRKTHAFHGVNIHKSTPATLSKYVKLSLGKKSDGFSLTVKNEATHTLFPQPLRLNQLRVSIERNKKTIGLKPVNFTRVIGTKGKLSMPWLADVVLSDSTIKAHETRTVSYDTVLQKGDSVVVKFGYYIANPKAAKKLGIQDPGATHFIVLSKKRFEIK